ncbi:MAG TPA: aldo/keto reductase [Nitrospiria bacterium]|nr:aldo/keto reductase [Nitrospiria bacterium]
MTDSRYATPEATAAFAAQNRQRGVHDAARGFDGLVLSSVGIGTYLGASDTVTDRIYEAAIARALDLGCNVIDTAINYRCQRSERAIGRALATGRIPREQIVVSTKGGYIPYDGEPPSDPAAYFHQTFVVPGIVDPSEVVAGTHCLSPRFLTHQIDRSLANLGLTCLDVYLLHNPETQLEEIAPDRFYDRMRAAFETLEERVREGRIRYYGIATWNGLRASATAAGLISLERLTGAARQAAGERHHFRVIQVPYSLAMPEAYTRKNQSLRGSLATVLDAAAALNLYVMGSAALYQSRLAQDLPGEIRNRVTGFATDAQRAVQFARSTPGIGTALVGMKAVGHVDENLGTLAAPVLSRADLDRLVPR